MMSLADLLAPFRAGKPFIAPAPLPKRSESLGRASQEDEVLFANQKRVTTGVDDFDRNFKILTDPYGLIIFKSMSSDRDTLFLSTFIDREEVDAVINALRRARDEMFPLTGEE